MAMYEPARSIKASYLLSRNGVCLVSNLLNVVWGDLSSRHATNVIAHTSAVDRIVSPTLGDRFPSNER